MIASRIAVQLKCLNQPLKKALLTAAQLGSCGVQFDAQHELRPEELSETGLRQLRKLLNDLNLQVASIAFPTQHGIAHGTGLQQRVESALRALKLASSLRATAMIFNLGPLPDSDESTGHATMVEVLGNLSAQANRLGVQLAAYAPGVDPSSLATFLASLPEGTLGVDLSPAPIIAVGDSPVDFIEALGPHIVHVHANDAVRDFASSQGVEVELGRGSADYPELLGRLEEFNYRGWITLVRHNSQQVVEDLANGVAYLRAL